MTDEPMLRLLAQQRDLIERYGWAVVMVCPDDDDPGPAFAYTIGLTAHGYPEFLIAGLPEGTAKAMLNDMGGRVFDRAQRFEHGQAINDLIRGYTAIVVEGPPNADLAPAAAYAHYDRDQVRMQQIVWPDTTGYYPWDDDWEFPADAQPVIGRPSEAL